MAVCHTTPAFGLGGRKILCARAFEPMLMSYTRARPPWRLPSGGGGIEVS